MISNIISAISSAMYDWILIIMLLAAGIYFTVASKFPQFRLFGKAIKYLKEKPKNQGKFRIGFPGPYGVYCIKSRYR